MRAGGRRVQAVIFDHDDTLVDWWGSWTACVGSLADDRVVDALATHVREVCWQVRPGTDDHVWHRNTWMIHTHRDRIWPDALPFLEPGELEQLMARFADELWVHFYPDTIGTLERLVDRYPLGVLSNNSLLAHEVERLRLERWFELALVAQPEPKPHPSAFWSACEHLDVDPSATVYVGDSVKADALGALGAGLIPVWLDRWGDPWLDRPAGVHRITGLGELPALLEELDA